MPSKRRPQARRARRPRAKSNKSTEINILHQAAKGNGGVRTSQLGARGTGARDRALHVLAAMRRDPSLSLTHAAQAEGVKAATVKKYFPSALRKSGGKFIATKSDRFQATLYLPDQYGNAVPITTRSSKERQNASKYLRDLGRYLRGRRDALASWHGRSIGGVQLVTAGRTIVAIEPALSEFSLYRAFNGGTA